MMLFIMTMIEYHNSTISDVDESRLSNLEVPVHQVVHVEVFIVLPERVEDDLGYVEPAEVEGELEEGEDWHL